MFYSIANSIILFFYLLLYVCYVNTRLFKVEYFLAY